MKISKYNKQHPSQKISIWQIRPLEYLEQDEGMVHITRKAAQKVYTFFVWALPFLAMIYLVFELSRFGMILGISRIVSLSSIGGAIAVNILMLTLHQPAAFLVFAAIAGLYVILRHKTNIQRLMAGNEPKIGQAL